MFARLNNGLKINDLHNAGDDLTQSVLLLPEIISEAGLINSKPDNKNSRNVIAVELMNQ